jgi:hypothetical protein
MVVTHVRRTPWGRTVELIMAISPGSKGNREEEPIGRGETKMAKADARVQHRGKRISSQGKEMISKSISVARKCAKEIPGRERRGISYPRWTMEPPNQSIESNRQERESGHGEKAPPARARAFSRFLPLCPAAPLWRKQVATSEKSA